MSAAMKEEVSNHLETLEATFKFDLNESSKNDQTYNFVLSPEEEKDQN